MPSRTAMLDALLDMTYASTSHEHIVISMLAMVPSSLFMVMQLVHLKVSVSKSTESMSGVMPAAAASLFNSSLLTGRSQP